MIRRRVDESSSPSKQVERMKTLRLRTIRFFGVGMLPRRRRLLLYMFGAVILFSLAYYFYLGNSDHDLDEIDNLETEFVSAEKWIVMTTIHSPTSTVKALSNLHGWQVLVVGDRKTPQSWRLPNVIFLDIKSQKSLGFKVLHHLPYDSYTRKTIGYLYAIKRGAKYIYEVDDDNFPEEGLNGFHVSSETTSHLVLSTNNLTSNPYIHFGQMSLWPRGYPLDRIGLSPDRTYELCETRSPAIQQGVVNGDPDVDALTRMTRKHKSGKLLLQFDKTAPPYMLPPGTYAPFNSQNTFFQRGAFWAMVLPTGVPDRVSDIFRSYWAQRLMWLIGESLAFAPPNAVQERSGHSDLKDAEDESEMYHGIGQYIKKLNEWQCEEISFYECVKELSQELVNAGFWKSQDVDVIDAWISDLSSIGYQEPEMIKSKPDPCLSEDHSLNVVFYPVEQTTMMPHDPSLNLLPKSTNREIVIDSLSALCGSSHARYWKLALDKAHKYSDTLLIISVYRDFETVVPLLEAFYKPNFPQILYCTNRKASADFIKNWRLSVLMVKRSPSVVECLVDAHDMQYNVRAYLHITDQMWMKTEDQLTKKQPPLMWLTGEFDAYKPHTLNLCDVGAIHCQVMSKDVLLNIVKDLDDMAFLSDRKRTKLRTCISKMERDPTWVAQKELVWITDMALHLPERLVPDLKRLRQIFSSATQLPYEFLAPLLLECDQLTTDYLEHSETLDSVSPEKNGDYVFPFPFYNVTSNNQDVRRLYCGHFKKFQ